ncbi:MULTISPECIES: chemotaxis protein CheW [unclassified Clostridium]|uniref:chemotaxis protein CheW n=1 Tax=unclassified Clostridium TaxID=2614128 RepID=UPI0002975689|nr:MULTISPECIES: chemotaxis protein CheW [unclassified Clostridium]EKQ56746.1 MAG: chemotaxis signal transduction protein [Clostridium sp. Maddingley MBC34-26]
MEPQGGKYLTFQIAEEEYGIPIQNIKEIIGMMDITSIPRTPEYIKGVINLRGKIIPIMDLRLKFNLAERVYNHRTCIIVVEINLADTKKLMGIVVDTVSEVVNIQKAEIEQSPQYGTDIEQEFLTGLGKVKGKVILLLKIEKVLNMEEMVLLKEMK